MAFKLPWSNFHELNLDWLLEKMKELEEKVNNIVGGATPATNIPNVDGIGSAGSSITYSRGDHTHPTDPSRASQTDLNALSGQLGYEVNQLSAAIHSVDAKIAFTSAAPQVDGVASPGSSNCQARADHVHPTDTSRASQTQVDTLQATVDSWQGSAAPYANSPEMDGVGSPGTVAAYARGDHQHPSDTSKFDKTGGTVSGIFDPADRNRHGETTATGWVRVASVPYVAGTSIDLKIVRRGATASIPAEMHKINLTILRAGAAWNDEESVGDTSASYINKVRYSDAGYIDIHMDQSAYSSIGVTISKTASSKADQDGITMENFDFVADAPDGETIVAEKTLMQNTRGSRSFTVDGKAWTFYRDHNVVSLYAPWAIGADLTAGNSTIGTLAAGWAPPAYVKFPITDNPNYPDAYLSVSSAGVVVFHHPAMTNGDACNVNGTWLVY